MAVQSAKAIGYDDATAAAAGEAVAAEMAAGLAAGKGRRKKKMRDCDDCGQPDTKACSGCKAVSNCGAACQRADWPRHKAECKRLTAQQA